MLRQIFNIWDVILRIFLICVLNYVCQGFNLDLSSALIHRHHRDTMFGFSVALHRDRGDSWLLVGAPKQQTSQPGVEKGGAVYRCSTIYPNACQSIPFDRSGSSTIFYRGRPEQTEDKSNQSFGATVHSSKDSGVIVACAPRYVYYSSNLRRRDPVGTCWVAMSSFSSFKEYSPCRTASWGYHRQGSCQAGFSAAVSKDGKRLFIGAVGSWYWQGQVFSQITFSKQLLSTNEAPEHHDDSYMGYSVAVGEFTGDDDSDVAVGMPRGNNLTGKVLILNSELQMIQNISGEQVGSYFGYAVTTADINGDGLDDVIIGAPLFSNFSQTYRSYETGRVDIVYQNRQHLFIERDILDGSYSKGRFGLAVTSAGDIDRDMYEDIAVGMPYGGDDGKGIVYIFHGSRNGIVKKPSQIIRPNDIKKSFFSTFGFSLSGGIDLDNNDYPDLLIGAYESDSVVFLKSRPVVTVTAILKVDPDVINLDDRGCSLRDGSLVSCMVIAICLTFTGINVNADLAFLYETQLDATKDTPRVFFLDDENHSKQNVSVRLRKDSTYCKSIYGYIKTDVRDKLIPITVSISYSLLDQEPNNQNLKPILNENIPSTLTKEISIRKNCGMDNICIPDLQVFLSLNMDQYLVGSRQRIELEVTVVNEKEDAFEAMMYISLPHNVDYINTEAHKSNMQTSCSGAQPDVTGTNDLVCDIGNPFPANETMTFTVFSSPSKTLFDLSDFVFIVNVSSTNEELEETMFNNQNEINLPVKVEVEVTLHGISDPKVISYNKTEVMPTDKINEMDAGPEVTHIYAFGNRGPSTIQEAEVNILWPTYTLYGKHLLYLMEQPEVRGKGRCQPVLDVNPLSLKKENEDIKPPPSNSSMNNVQNARSATEEEDIRHLKRQQREDDEYEDPYVQEMFCGPILCTRFYCTVYELAKDEQVFFVIRARLWKDTIDQLGYSDIQISSKLITKVISLPYQVETSLIPYKVYTISTKLSSDESKITSKPIPLWIFILAVSSGLLLFGLLALLLWKLGFFQRRRFQDEFESEPLGRYEKNGYVWSTEDVML